MYLISAPPSNKWVAKLCLNVCGVTFFLIPTFLEADFIICWIVLLLYFSSLLETKIEPRDISFETLMNHVRNGLIKIPDFQREFVWSKKQIVDLLDSIYRHYSIGSFLFWITNEKLF